MYDNDVCRLNSQFLSSMACLWCRTSTILFLCLPTFVFHLYEVKGSTEVLSCARVNSTRCKFLCNSGGMEDVIDLSLLDGSPDKPSFSGIQDIDNSSISYMWSPCTKFLNTCTDSVYVCQENKNVGNYNLGDIGPTVAFDKWQKQYYMSYLGPVQRTFGEGKTKVFLAYDDGNHPRTSRMESNGNYYTMTLYTKYAPDRNDGTGSDSLSTGTILIIVFSCVVVLYLGVGILFTKYRTGAHGKEMIPHYSFWSKIPGLAMDGCRYTINLIQGCGSSTSAKLVGQRKDYEEI